MHLPPRNWIALSACYPGTGPRQVTNPPGMGTGRAMSTKERGPVVRRPPYSCVSTLQILYIHCPQTQPSSPPTDFSLYPLPIPLPSMHCSFTPNTPIHTLSHLQIHTPLSPLHGRLAKKVFLPTIGLSNRSHLRSPPHISTPSTLSLCRYHSTNSIHLQLYPNKPNQPVSVYSLDYTLIPAQPPKNLQCPMTPAHHCPSYQG